MANLTRKIRNQTTSACPVLSRVEERILGKIIEWADEYTAAKDAGHRFASQHVPTTEKCSNHFEFNHSEMLVLLNQFETWQLIIKRRRLSAGIAGDGYDGSLHSEVMPTELGRRVLLQNKQG